MYKLVISDDEGKTIIVPLVRDLITVGRQDGNTIRLTERNVSRSHARFVRDEKGYRIEDLGSFNGVTVNGVRIEKAAPLNDGDRVGVGDYVIALRSEATTRATTVTKTRSSLPSAFGAAPPARLVMLSPPAPGAEFSLSKPTVSIGRLEELDLCVSHRSISREHARITQKSGSFEIEDLKSANGIRINGSAVKRGPLRAGDIVELGQVRFRFVGQGESYVFDPSDEAAVAPVSTRSGPKRQTVAAVVGLAVVGAGILAVWQEGSPPAGAAMRKEAAPAVPALPEPKTEAMPIDGPRLERALDQCQEALAVGEYAAAGRAAEEGLALPGSGEELATCKRSATEGMRASSAYEEGTKALAENKLEDAYFLFAGIPDDHAFREKPEVKLATERVAQDRLARAKKQLRSSPAEARELATSVLEMQSVAQPVREEAQRILSLSGERSGGLAATPVPSEESAAKPPKAPSTPEPPANAEQEDAAKVARTCLARGDQRCVVKALEGKAQSAQELALLIETYRALGETKKAVKHMETFVARYATARQTPQYRQFIAKHEQ
jgi:ABC transport system ATP-binding/permease protein